MKRPPARHLLVAIAYLSFVALGLPGGLIGVAWPAMRRSFGLSLDAVGAMLIVMTVGSLVSSFASGPAVSRFGAGVYLAVSSLVMALALTGLALAPAWWVVVLCGLPLGIAAGGIDSALNVHFAENHDSRLMNWLHACFGLGATVGPAAMTAVVSAGGSWRWGYAGVGLAQLALAICFGLTARRWREPATPLDLPSGGRTRDAGMSASLKLPVVALSIGLFLLMAGVESIAGQWPYSLFTEGRGISPTAAGVWMSVYWGALTAGRILYGLAGARLRVVPSLRVAMVGAVLGAALLWQRSIGLLSFLGLALIGFSIAPLIPLLQLVTPRRVGVEHTANVIGFQTAAGYLGVGVLPALAGLLAESRGLETLGPLLLVSSLLMVLIHEAIRRRSVGQTTIPDTRPDVGTL